MREKLFRTNNQIIEGAGALLVDKPVGWTSHDVVKFVRGFGFKKVGHCGTLDPNATGLLVLLIGKATKLSRFFNTQDKSYEGEMCLGIETNTQDADGNILKENDYSQVTDDLINETFNQFVGAQDQIPPMVSAKKIDGKPLYKLARKGIVVQRQPVPITIYQLVIKKIKLPIISFATKCSKGTYVRTLSFDIGRRIGCGAHLQSLRRIESGDFKVYDAFPISEIRTWDKSKLFENCIPIEALLP